MVKVISFLIPFILGGTVIAADLATNPYTDRTSHYELEIATDIPQGERIEIMKDKAQVDMVGWNDEYRISIKPQIPSNALGATDKDFNVTATRPLLSNKVEYKQGDVTAFIEPITEKEFDIDFTLDSKPDTNIFEYKIEGAEDFDFFYQPALTQEEIDEGAERPDNVVGSYAVYHKTKANNCTNCGHALYATGKVMHIYRPKAIDDNGNEEWAILGYQNGVLSVTVSQKFLDTATYPVIVDPTFGYTSIGGSTGGSGQGWWLGRIGTLSEDGTVTSISAYGDDNASPNSIIKAMLVEKSGMTIVSNGIGGTVVPPTLGNPAWNVMTYSTNPTVSNGVSYYAGNLSNGDDAACFRRFQDTGGVSGDSRADVTNSLSSPTDPTDYANSTNIYSIYATYTAAEAGPTTEAGFQINSGHIDIHGGHIDIY